MRRFVLAIFYRKDFAVPHEQTGVGDSQPLLGLGKLAQMTFLGIDRRPLFDELLLRIKRNQNDANALMDLSILLQLSGERDAGLAIQAEAIALQQVYRLQPARMPSAVHLLAIMTTGDLTQNNAVEFLVADNDILLDILFVAPNLPLPAVVPDHDVAIVAICESDDNLKILRQLETAVRRWPRTMLNLPERIARSSRNGACTLVPSQSGLCVPRTLRVDRVTLSNLIWEPHCQALVLDVGDFPLIVRPVGSHKGQGQAKVETPSAMIGYLQTRSEQEFYVARFVDYRSPDGQFRKYRIVLIDGQPELCHLAISDHWMVHYMNAGMTESSSKRGEEERAMREFDHEFAKRHRIALQTISRRLDLDYVGIDCGETPEGELLIFEFDSGMTVHSMDPPSRFPYKGPQMRKVFGTFRQMLLHAKAQGRVARAG